MRENKNTNFKERIRANEENNKKIFELKEKYEKNEIFEKDMTDEEIKALIQLYENKEKEIDHDIAIRKAHIANLLKKSANVDQQFDKKIGLYYNFTGKKLKEVKK